MYFLCTYLSIRVPRKLFLVPLQMKIYHPIEILDIQKQKILRPAKQEKITEFAKEDLQKITN